MSSENLTIRASFEHFQQPTTYWISLSIADAATGAFSMQHTLPLEERVFSVSPTASRTTRLTGLFPHCSMGHRTMRGWLPVTIVLVEIRRRRWEPGWSELGQNPALLGSWEGSTQLTTFSSVIKTSVTICQSSKTGERMCSAASNSGA